MRTIGILLVATLALGISSSTSASAGPLEEGLAALDRQDYATAHGLLRPLAEQNNLEAQYHLGLLYSDGLGVRKSDAEAASWYRRAAEHGHAPSQSDLGMKYVRGAGVSQSNAEAIKWFRRAAKQGYARGQHNLGVTYTNGIGLPKSDAEALNWYRKAAEQGYALSQINLGLMYLNGTGVAQDDTRALYWYRKAAEQGNEAARKDVERIEYLVAAKAAFPSLARVRSECQRISSSYPAARCDMDREGRAQRLVLSLGSELGAKGLSSDRTLQLLVHGFCNAADTGAFVSIWVEQKNLFNEPIFFETERMPCR